MGLYQSPPNNKLTANLKFQVITYFRLDVCVSVCALRYRLYRLTQNLEILAQHTLGEVRKTVFSNFRNSLYFRENRPFGCLNRPFFVCALRYRLYRLTQNLEILAQHILGEVRKTVFFKFSKFTIFSRKWTFFARKSTFFQVSLKHLNRLG